MGWRNLDGWGKHLTNPIKVAVVDDSAVVRQVFTEIITPENGMELVFTASDPLFALDKLKSHKPNVIILDIEMPRMDGLSFLKKLMQENPIPVIICSTLAEKNSEIHFQALELGAVEIITKPKIGLKSFLEESVQVLLYAIASASQANLKIFKNNTIEKKEQTEFKRIVPDISRINATEKIVAIGSSTGGTQAIEKILKELPAVGTPGIVIVQHMPEKFTELFAKRLNTICKVEVTEAKHLDRILPGKVLIAPGNKHMQVKRSGAQYIVEVLDGPLVNRHRPSVDVLFRSVANEVGKNAKGIILTGMGDDGARGLLEMKNAGAYTIAQNEESCVVFGMPKEAIKRNAHMEILDLADIHKEIHF